MYPFQSKEYQDLFKKHFITDSQSIVVCDDTEYEIIPDKRAVFVGMKPVLNNQEITDYGDIVNPSKEKIQSHIDKLKTSDVTSVQFGYVRETSPLFQILSEMSPDTPNQQEVAPFISLPSSWDGYLESLERTDRKELKRKWKRLETISYKLRFFEISKKEDDIEMFEAFIRLHKLSDHNKEQFMSDFMKDFFRDLLSLRIPGWRQKLAFLYIDDKPAASIFYFENEKEILLYNSGYDPEQKYYSAGFLLVAHLIKKSIEDKKTTFDFLRGNERYKYDLGGKDERLFQFNIHFTASTSF
jgi:hypothetical protein